jgi:phage terminase small subunit
MPRKSAAELAVPAVDGRPSRLCPRGDAPAQVRRVFNDLVASEPPEHFRAGDADLVEQYAQSVVLARQAFKELARHGPVIKGRASPWLVVLEKAHRSAVALSARLRLSPQNRTDPKSVGRHRVGPMSAYDKPFIWDDDNG